MSKNEIASTLFRFVNVRNPEPRRIATMPVNFVLAPAALQTSLYYNFVNTRAEGITKAQALREASLQFKDALKSQNDAIALAQPLHELGDWILKNRSTATNAELEQQVAKIAKPIDTANEAKLWNNLFYQITTKDSFYIKEAVMQMLLANHVVRSLKKGDADFNSELTYANIALPSQLFTEDLLNDSDSEDTEAVITEAPKGLQKRQALITKANHKSKQGEVLLKELQKLERSYKTSYQKAYDANLKLHGNSVKATLDKYYKDVEDARKNFCQVREAGTVFNPEDPCQQPDAIPYPTLPDLDFSFEPEITPTSIKSSLTPESYTALTEALGYNYAAAASGQKTGVTKEMLIEEHGSYDSLCKTVKKFIADNNKTIGENTIVGQTQVSIAGVRIPVSEDGMSLPGDQNHYAVCGVQSGLTFLYDIYTWLPEGQNIIKVGVSQTLDGKTTKSVINKPVVAATGTGQQLAGVYAFTFADENLQNGPVIDFDLYLSSGEVKSIKDIEAALQFTQKGYFQQPSVARTASTSSTTAVKHFVPSGFGLRQLGIADYLKVEQSVHCYIEGEVSHIENVMAREYKEKASRRLLRTEDTTTTSSETEKEKLTDTTSTDRFEMHSEIAQVIQQSKEASGYANAGVTGEAFGGSFHADAGLSFANSTSSENSTNLAVTKAKEITQRAMDRVVSKVKEERIRKVIEEFEENNKHGFDNRQGSDHVVGVYRWVDKLYKNQIVNYGRRLTFEFMVPEPGRLHELGMTVGTQTPEKDLVLLTKPVDPRKVTGYLGMPDYSYINETKAAYWAGMYNAEIEPYPDTTVTVGKALAYGKETANPKDNSSGAGLKDEVEIPEGYRSVWCTVNAKGKISSGATMYIAVGTKGYPPLNYSTAIDGISYGFECGGFTKTVPISIATDRYYSFQATVAVSCTATESLIKGWEQRSFNAIMKAYEDAVAKYNEQEAKETAIALETKKTNPGFYRQIENVILRKNCISYLIDQNPNSDDTYGKSLFTGSTFSNYEVTVNSKLSNYGAFVQFIESAFEWDIMSYNFYPYYWGSRDRWNKMYQFDENSDPIFRNFMQAGMAKVTVTVKPGFEEAVKRYLKTGEIWNGGQVPEIDDDNYMDVVRQIRAVDKKPVKVGKAWITRLPTDLTILQADSIGLKVERALPCNCGDTDLENPLEVPCSDNFEITQAQLSSDTDIPVPVIKPSSGVRGVIRGVKERNIRVELQDINGFIVDVAYTIDERWELGPIVPGKYVLVIDSGQVLVEPQYVLVEGTKESVVFLHEGEVLEVNIAVEFKG
ncbi:hypothetical protein [Flavobacterium psychrotrophum]|uniref:hypothetical protein n=1 Tax=Flavobacterium psychrotrophum TaxID=2294119 RepID=UPI0019698DD1|nr:hypothetical protein [Flavobacterium psychrotrophum]